MAKCRCGARPKAGVPPIATLRLQDLNDPNYFFAGVFLSSPPPPSTFSVVYGEDSQTLCNRDPELLQFEFAPYSTNASTAALKKLWRKTCECKPELGVWTHVYTYSTFVVSSFFPNGRRETFTVNSNTLGAFVGMRLEILNLPNSSVANWYGYSSTDNYRAEKLLNSSSINGGTSRSITSSFSQEVVTPGCYGSARPLPEQPDGIASPWVPTVPFSDPPPVAYIPRDPPKRPVVFTPSPDECCDCA